jgi:hypothetical protein
LVLSELNDVDVCRCDSLQSMSDLLVTGLISGEIRSGLTPNKPQRTSSIRDANVEGPKRRVAPQNDDSGYESVELSNGKHMLVRKQVIMSHCCLVQVVG